MKFLISAILGTLFLSPVESLASDGVFDLERIQTAYGRSYHDIFILGADSHGLTFRHRDGIAKIEFSSLSENIRMLYETTDEVSDSDEVEGAQNAPPAEPADSRALGLNDFVITVYHRLTLYAPTNYRHVCFPCQGGERWPSSWSRYHPAHQLVIPCYRGCAVRDFLLLSGLAGGTCQNCGPTDFGRDGLFPSIRGI